MGKELVQPLDKSPGIYFDPANTLRLINDHIHFIIPVDLKFIQSHLTNTKNVLDTFKVICEQNKALDDFRCLNMLHPLTSLYDDILRDYDAISHLFSPRPKRSAWFAGIGTLMKKLFGTMNEDDSEKYSNAIQMLHSNDKKLASLVKQNIFLSKSAISNFNETIITILNNEARLNDITNALLKNITIVTNELLFRNKISEVLNVLQANLLTLSFKLEEIVNSIMFANSNTLHPSIVTPTQLYTDIESNIRHIPKYKEFPINIDLRNINALLKVSELAVYSDINSVIFVLRIPLVYHIEYDLYRIIPVPVPHNVNVSDSYAMIIPTANYVALSKDKSSYCTLNDLNTCKSLHNGNLLCDVSNILSVNTNPICEIELMIKIVKALPSQCETKFIYGYVDIWQNLGHNNWIFVQTRPTKVSIECNTNLKEVIVSGTGILSLEPQCVAFCRNIKLLAMLNLEVNIPHINSDFNLIDDKCCNLGTFKKLNVNTSSFAVSNVNLDSLKNLNNQADLELKNLDEFINKESNMFSNNVSFPILTIILIISFTTFIIYFLYKFNSCALWLSICKKPTSNEEDCSQAEQLPLPRLRV